MFHEAQCGRQSIPAEAALATELLLGELCRCSDSSLPHAAAAALPHAAAAAAAAAAKP